MPKENEQGRDTPLGRVLSISLAFLMIGLIVGQLAYVSGVQHERSRAYPAAYAASAKEDAKLSCRGMMPEAAFDCVYQRVEAAGSQAIARQDLEAQEGMWFWASFMAWTAMGTLMLTGYALWFIRGTLRATELMGEETRKLTQESIDATRAMVRQNELTERSQRPWLSVKVLEMGPLIKRETSSDLRLVFSIENTGSSPALYALPHAVTIQSDSPYVDLHGFAAAGKKKLLHEALAFAPGQKVKLTAECPVDTRGISREGLNYDGSYPTFLAGMIYEQHTGNIPLCTAIVLTVSPRALKEGEVGPIQGHGVTKTFML